ncbi:MAG: hypothetical protein Q7R58_00525 [bacterium]|nr:hypothetical protein [bacterium]
MNRIPMLFAALIFCLGLEGCAALGVASLAPELGALADLPSSDSDLFVVQLAAPMTGESFVENAKEIARRLEYQVVAVRGNGVTERAVVLTKENRSYAETFIGRDWRYTVILGLEEDGRTVQVNAKTWGNNHRGDPGTARKVVDEFKGSLGQLYASQ